MNKKWTIYGVAVGLCLITGCQKSDPATNQTPPPATAQAPNSATNAPPQQPGTQQVQAPTPEQAAAANPANQQPMTPPEPPKPFVVPAGTSLPVILSTSISSYSATAGQSFEASLAAPVLVDGEEAIPKGARVTGTVVNVKKQGKFKGEALLTIKLTQINVRGKDYLIYSHTYSGTEKGKGKRTAVITGGGAAAGALIGGLAGGGKGAAIGAGIGGAGGLAASGGTGGQNVNLPAETKINFKLAEAVTIDR
jgi:hypothetical protein